MNDPELPADGSDAEPEQDPGARTRSEAPEERRPAGEIDEAGPGPDDPPNDSDDPVEAHEIHAVLLDMGGVILDLGEARGLPWGELDRRGREALLERLREAAGEGAGRVADEALDRWLFEPWRRGYSRRVRTGREEPWGPHLARLQRHVGVRISRGGLLETWARPYLDGLRTMTGAREALDRLATADLRLGLVSNVPLPGSLYARVLERQGLAGFFDVLLFSYDQGTRKPGPGLLLRALEALGVDPEAAVMVGDRRSRDVAAGQAAGARTVWVQGPDDDGPEPDAEIASIVELPELLGV
jgi:FMN phosphatase YigB (HAD superfamily)